MSGRWAAGLVDAALPALGLATALIRSGIGALILGAGDLAYHFSQLVTWVCGVGDAFRLPGDLASEVWSRIGHFDRRGRSQDGCRMGVV
jgi:hypothetical protein